MRKINYLVIALLILSKLAIAQSDSIVITDTYPYTGCVDGESAASYMNNSGTNSGYTTITFNYFGSVTSTSNFVVQVDTSALFTNPHVFPVNYEVSYVQNGINVYEGNFSFTGLPVCNDCYYYRVTSTNPACVGKTAYFRLSMAPQLIQPPPYTEILNNGNYCIGSVVTLITDSALLAPHYLLMLESNNDNSLSGNCLASKSTIDDIGVPINTCYKWELSVPGIYYYRYLNPVTGCYSSAQFQNNYYELITNPIPTPPTITESNNVLYANVTSGDCNFIIGCQYKWFLNGVQIPLANTDNYNTNGVIGNYTVQLYNYCDSVMSPAYSFAVGLQDNAHFKSDVYPSPFNEKIIVDFSDEVGTYQLVNTLGEVLLVGKLTKGKQEITTSSINNGYYVLHVSNANTTLKKVIVK